MGELSTSVYSQIFILGTVKCMKIALQNVYLMTLPAELVPTNVSVTLTIGKLQPFPLSPPSHLAAGSRQPFTLGGI